MNAVKMAAIVLIAAGVLGLVYGSFSYTKDTHEAKLGPLELSVKDKETVNIPVWAGVGARPLPSRSKRPGSVHCGRGAGAGREPRAQSGGVARRCRSRRLLPRLCVDTGRQVAECSPSRWCDSCWAAPDCSVERSTQAAITAWKESPS